MLAVLIVGACCTLAAQEIPAVAVKNMERVVSDTMAAHHLPAASVAVVLDSKIAWTEAFGTADIENHVPATSDSVFRIASVSKAITATAVMQLVEDGRLKLDDPIVSCVPTYKVAPSPTIRQLLTHTAGVRHYRGEDENKDSEFINTRHYDSVTASVAQFSNDPLVFKPGTSFLYSTHGFTLLGACVEQLTHEPFGHYVQDHIFAPAAMSASHVDSVTALIPNRVHPYSATEAGVVENAPLLDSSNRIPGGGFVSSAPDMARFAIGLFTHELLRAKTLQTMFTPLVLKDPQGNPFPIDLGWATGGSVGRDDVVWMGGNQPGATSMLFLIPKSQTAIVILTNKGGEGGAVIKLANEIATALGR